MKTVRLMPRASTIPGYIRNARRTDVPDHYTDEQALAAVVTDRIGPLVWDPVMRCKRRAEVVVAQWAELVAAGDYSITTTPNL